MRGSGLRTPPRRLARNPAKRLNRTIAAQPGHGSNLPHISPDEAFIPTETFTRPIHTHAELAA